MLKNWIFDYQLIFFLELLARFCGYDFNDLDLDAITFGLRKTDYEKNQWFDYVFEGKIRAAFRLSIDVGSSVVSFELDTPAEVERKAEVAVEVLNYLAMKRR